MIPVGIVTTRGREALLAQLLDALGEPRPRIYLDHAPGSFENHRAAWRDLLTDHPRALLLEDDVRPNRTWRSALRLIVPRFVHTPVVALFSRRDYTTTDQARAQGFAKRRGGPLTDQATIIERDTYQAFDTWFDTRAWEHDRRLQMLYNPGPTPPHDKALGMFLDKHRSHHVVVVPNLFEHVGVDSAEGHAWIVRGKPRTSATYPGDDYDIAAHLRRLWTWPT